MNQSKWDSKYGDNQSYIFGTEPNTFLAEYFSQLPRGKVLCLGDGEGRNSVFLAKQRYQVTAVDMSLIGIEKAKKLAEENDVSINFVHRDLQDYEIGENCWQGIVSIFCHVPVSLRQKIHADVVRGLKPAGVFLLESYTPDQLKHGTGGPPNADLLMTSATLSQELTGLSFSHLVEIERDVQEGSGHSGWSAVVQLVAVK